MNRLTREKKVRIVAALVEGNSVRSTCRMTGTSKGAVLKLLAETGTACREYQDSALRNLPCKRIQCDEIWSFCYSKEKNVPADMRGTPGVGDVWTWTAIDADTKLCAAWLVGKRDAGYATEFIADLRSRLRNRVQLTTDGHSAYLSAVDYSFAQDVDYAMLIKIYGRPAESETRYSPAECIGCESKVITGNPDPKHVSTSYVERQNLTMRMSMRRFTRLTNAFSKKIENHTHALALYFMYYNFGRVHSSLRVTPAMEAGVSDHVWSVEEIVDLVPEPERCVILK